MWENRQGVLREFLPSYLAIPMHVARGKFTLRGREEIP